MMWVIVEFRSRIARMCIKILLYTLTPLNNTRDGLIILKFTNATL